MSKFFINRPIVAIVIAIVTVILGVVSLASLPTSQFPNIVPPEILVTATYPGADAKTLSQAVATPIEQQMNGVDNMIYMDSVSANNGVVQLFVDFDIKTSPDIDQVLGQLRVDQAQSQLPAQVTVAGLTVQKSLTSPLMLIAINSPGGKLGQDFLTNYAVINLQDQIARVRGSFPRAGFRRHVCAARVGSARQDGQARSHRAGSNRRDSDSEQRQSCGTDRRRAHSQGAAIHVHRAHPGTPGKNGRVRQHHYPRQRRRLDTAP